MQQPACSDGFKSVPVIELSIRILRHRFNVKQTRVDWSLTQKEYLTWTNSDGSHVFKLKFKNRDEGE